MRRLLPGLLAAIAILIGASAATAQEPDPNLWGEDELRAHLIHEIETQYGPGTFSSAPFQYGICPISDSSVSDDGPSTQGCIAIYGDARRRVQLSATMTIGADNSVRTEFSRLAYSLGRYSCTGKKYAASTQSSQYRDLRWRVIEIYRSSPDRSLCTDGLRSQFDLLPRYGAQPRRRQADYVRGTGLGNYPDVYGFSCTGIRGAIREIRCENKVGDFYGIRFTTSPRTARCESVSRGGARPMIGASIETFRHHGPSSPSCSTARSVAQGMLEKAAAANTRAACSRSLNEWEHCTVRVRGSRWKCFRQDNANTWFRCLDAGGRAVGLTMRLRGA